MKRLAHVSDLRVGRNAATDDAAAALCDALVAQAIDAVVVTGDLTNGGRRDELALFREIFRPFVTTGRLYAVPGDRDRRGDDLVWALMPGRVVQCAAGDGVHVVRLDSTSLRPRDGWTRGGSLFRRGPIDAAPPWETHAGALDAALASAPRDQLVVVALHDLSEVGATARGTVQGTLLARLAGRCDLVLHGGADAPSGNRILSAGARPTLLMSAGPSSKLGRAWVFGHHDGTLRGGPLWLDVATAMLGMAGSGSAVTLRPRQFAPASDGAVRISSSTSVPFTV